MHKSFEFIRRAAAGSDLVRADYRHRSLRNNDSARVSCEEALSPYLEAMRFIPCLTKISLSSKPELVQEAYEVFTFFHIKAEGELTLGGKVIPFDFEKNLDLDEVIAKAGDMPRAQIVSVIDKVNETIGDVKQGGFDVSSNASFWGQYLNLEIDRARIEDALEVWPLDAWAIMSRVLDEEVEVIDYSKPPERWTSLTISRVKNYLDNGVSPDACDSVGVSALNAAVLCGRHADVHWLMVAGADLDEADLTGMNPVSCAVSRSDEGLLEVLVNAGANPDGSKFAPTIPLAMSSSPGSARLKLVRKLLDLGASTSQRLPDGTRLSDDYSRLNDEPVERLLASLNLKRRVESAFSDAAAEAEAWPASVSGGSSLSL
jgi:hypothetical protein